jgi:hypothetical protein
MTAPFDRDWITSELAKGVAADRALADEAKARASSPPDPSLSLVYNELATAEDRIHSVLETIATRYGFTPTHRLEGGIGEAFGWLKGKVSEMGSSPSDRLTYDLLARAASVFWCTAWVHTFEAIGDAPSAQELVAVLTEKKAHCAALQECLNRLVAERVKAVTPGPAIPPAIGPA